jgi:hypothetical protein
VQVEDERELEERYPAEASAATSIQGPEGEGRARGLTITVDYEKQVSAAKSRPRFDAMMRDAHRGAFAVLLIWALDRFGRDAIASAPDLRAERRVSPLGSQRNRFGHAVTLELRSYLVSSCGPPRLSRQPVLSAQKRRAAETTHSGRTCAML